MHFVVALAVTLSLVTSAFAQSSTTQTGSVSNGASKVYTFVPASFGQVTATLSWDTPSAHLIMVLVCGSGTTQTYGIAAGLLDRFARFESGIIPGDPCGLGVTSIDETANFRLNVTRTADQLLAPSNVRPSQDLGEARPGTFISDEAIRVLGQLMRLIR